MTVRLMLTCLCDAFYGEVGIATVRVLEHAGCTVEFPKGQTCCGQPPFNAGDWPAARPVGEHWQKVFGGSSSPIVTPSSSCAAMIREGYPLLFGKDSSFPTRVPIGKDESSTAHNSDRGSNEHWLVYELSEFLVRQLGVEKWPLGFSPGPMRAEKIAYHRACHGRGIGLKDEQEMLLRSIPGIELHEIAQAEQCCGFGGAFSVGHPSVSAGIGNEKLRNVIDTGAKTLVSGDMGCLMHLKGLIDKEGFELQTKHFAEILADAIPARAPA
jgi:L-lactate dehydrogenase complex protein LldE